MKICFVNMPLEYYSPVSGGAMSTVIAEYSAELEALGHHVYVLTYTDDNPVHTAGRVTDLGRAPGLAKPARAVDRLSRRLLRRPFPAYEQYLRRVRWGLRSLPEKPDVAIAFNDFAAPRTMRRVLPGVKVVTWLQNELPAHRPSDLALPDAVVAGSDYIRKRAVQGGVPRARAHTILNGVNLVDFHAEGRQQHDPPRVLLVGRLDPNKGFHVALAALAEARAAGCRFDTTLVGARWWYGADEPSPYEIELLAALDRIGGRHVGLVPRNKIADLYREHDLAFVLSISQEPFGLVVLEAMAAGCAVVASPRGGIPEAAGDAAVLVDPDDAAAVAAETIRLLSDADELARWRARGVARAASASWRVGAQAFVDLMTTMDAE